MSTRDDGGPAFPVLPPCDMEGASASGYPYPAAGMTLRDYFAAALAPTFINLLANSLLNGDEGMTPAQCASKAAYTMADAMIAERAK